MPGWVHRKGATKGDLLCVCIPSSASPKVGVRHQGESGLDSFSMENGCEGEKIRWGRELFTYLQLINFIQRRGLLPKQVWFVFFLPGTKFMQGQFMSCMCDGMKIYGHPG